MAQIINTNIASLNAQRNLNNSQSANSTALERLSSGLRINSAKDDAAGLAISTKFESQTRGLNQAIRNAGDGISLAQTAEGALGTMTDNLQRIRELAVQSSNATNSDEDRAALQQEVDALVAEITRTGEETNFNGRNLFDGEFNGTFQIGANAGQTVEVKIGELTASQLGVSTASGVSALGNENSLQNGDLVINGVAIAPSTANSDTSSVEGNGASAIAKVAAINEQTEATGVSARVNTNVATGSEMTAGSTEGTVTLNGVDVSITTGGVDAGVDRDSVISAINAKSGQTGVVARDGGDASGVILEAEDGRNITVDFGSDFAGDPAVALTDDELATAQASTGLATGTSYGGFTLTSENGSDVVISGGQGTGTGDVSNAGLTAGVYSGREAAVVSESTNSTVVTNETTSTFTSGEFTIAADTQINATNNSFEVSLNGADFAEVTLGSGTDVGSGNGQYDNVEQLAAQINASLADTSITENDAFRDADDNVLFTAVGNIDDGTITFETVEEGEDANIVARTGSGTIDIPTVAEETLGAAGETVQTFTISDFKFDGNNVFTGGTGVLDVDFTNGAGTTTFDVTLNQTTADNGRAFTAEEVVDLVNAELVTDGVAATASVGDDGVSIVLTADAGSADPYTAIADGGTTLAATELQSNYQSLSNGDSVITDVDEFAQLLGQDATDLIGMSVDGAAAQDVNFGTSPALISDYETYTGVSGSYATDLAAAQNNADPAAQAESLSTFMNNVFSTQAAGTGVTATAVGDQVVLSSRTAGNPDGVVELRPASNLAQEIGTAAALTGGTADSTTVGGAAGTALTGDFNVDDEGFFLSADPDPLDPSVEAQRTALVVETGFNDTFSIAIDGGAEQDVTIAAGSYETMDDLAAAVNTALGAPSTTSASAPTVTSTAQSFGTINGVVEATGTEFDFSTNNLTFTLTDQDGNTDAITVIGDFADADADVAGDALAGNINGSITNTNITAAWDEDNDQLVFTTGTEGTAGSVAISSSSANAGTNNSQVFVVDTPTTAGQDATALAQADLDFSTYNSTFDISLDGATAQTFTIAGDQSGAADFATGMAALATQLETDINTAFGAGSATVTFNASTNGFDIESTTAGASGAVAITNATAGGTGNDLLLVQDDSAGGGAPSTSASATVATSDDNQSLIFTSATQSATSAVDITNGKFAIEGGFTTGAQVTQLVEPNVLETGDLVLNGTAIRGAEASDDTASDSTALTSDAAGSGIAVAAAINAATSQTGVTAEVNATLLTGGIIEDTDPKADDGSAGELTINGVTTSGITLTGDGSRDRQAAIDVINAVSGQTGVVASDNGESISLTADDGRNISVAINNRAEFNEAAGFDSSNFGNSIGLSADEAGIGEADFATSATYENTAGTTYSTVALKSATAITIEAGERGADELTAIGLQVGTFGGGEDGTFLKDVDISTFEGAQAAITAIDNALETVASQRAELGALQNRFESTVDNLAVTAENLTAANSRIRDADFAAETAELSRTQVLQQAGISILAQANQRPQQVLSLLG